MSTCISIESIHPANGVKHWLLLTPTSGSLLNTSTTEACQWVNTLLLNTGTTTDAYQWEFVKHWP
ncbi:hypothetical protein SLEP1_g27580 [Rubroshorea leprosula]|uniref:Uncharacterized protein n=1 Tax=Rubroshorea leprosula TaxID=152421 RepID=A0AAV5JTL4_9ROSI|nr:hypothetical protein SLEP1_g27580 [Rubroshorea leprosula]